MERLNFKLNKKSNKTDLIIAKIHELTENDYGDPARLQMIQTYLEENVPLDQTDTSYLKKICKEYAQIKINENKLSVPSPKNDELKEQLTSSNEKINKLVTEKKQPFKKFMDVLERKMKNENVDSKKTVTKKNIKSLLLQYEETQMKLDYVRSDLDSIQLTVSKKLSEVLGLQKDLVFLKDELTSL